MMLSHKDVKPGTPEKREENRVVFVACGAHALHDGYTDLIYVMLPVWQHEFGLGFAALGLMKTLFSGALAGYKFHLAYWLSGLVPL